MSALHNESELIKGLARGDQKSFKAIYMHYYPHIRYFIFGMLKTDEDANDLSQEVFIKVWRHREQMTQVKSFGSYLFVLTRNLIYDYFSEKRILNSELNERLEIEDKFNTPYENLLVCSLKEKVDDLIDLMPAQRKQIYCMSREKGLSNAEIADRLKITKKTVENHLNIALSEIRKVVKVLLLFFGNCAIIFWV
jgi:RNA polymerase sigma-70 factor, ECF subfamily